MARAFAEIAFTPSVLAAQRKHGSAGHYSEFLSEDASPADRLGPREAEFISGMDGFYQATIGSNGWPYVQFRGGPPGFLKIIDERTIGYAGYRGNRQYLSYGNLAGDDRLALILMDYASRRRLKIWGRAKLVDRTEHPDLVASLRVPEYRARTEYGVVIAIEALDWNCPAHIPQRFTTQQITTELTRLHDEIARLKKENDALRTIADEKARPDIISSPDQG